MIRTFGYFSFILIIYSFVLSVNGCTEEEAVLSTDNRIIADSLIQEETKLLIVEIDSLCKLVYKENFDRAVDSISKIRLEEIEKYIPN